MHTQKTSTLKTVAWLLGSTRDLLPPLLLACVLACATRLASLGIYVIAGLGLAKALQLDTGLLPACTGWGMLAAAVIVLGLAKGALRYLEQYVGHRVAFLSLARLRNRMYEAFERQAPFTASTKNSGGMLAKATSDIDKVEVFFAHTLPPAVAAVVVSALATWGTWSLVGSEPALVLLVGYVLIGVLIPAIGVGSLRSSARSTAAARGVQNQLLTDTLAGIDVIHGFNAGKPVMESLRGSLQQTRQAARSTGSWTAVRATLTQLVIWGSLLTLFVLLGSAGEFGTLLLLCCALVPSYEAVRAVDGFILGLQDSLASARRLHATAAASHPVHETANPVPLPATGTLRVSDLCVEFEGYRAVRGVDFDLEPGSLIALVGESGSGKSSIAAALVRSVEAEGMASFAGVQLEDASLAQLRQRIILVSQEAVMIRGTLRENLLLGAEGISDAAMEAVLEELGMGPWLRKQKDGLQTRLGDRFARLSGGQRQRVALARALLRQPAVLILDESTSALDASSEQLVLDAVERRRAEGMAVLMISHRLSILKRTRSVLVLHDGQVRERGAAQELLADEQSLFSRMSVREADRILPS
ncbi:ATP-binding cassette subfamily C protein CydC [Glutamicibacter mysorens]|uniref:ATP-binding cassette subfamily C protein CydC n=1 Tax=Glutamicibacter mysorens TaxID=257984 RepID=A0ABX4MYX2_9MICC|nr:ABC transporter ATP-binding protein [Glutamicibacter mysorens]PJJ44784.1 ATP-binding cassette subfamily C protein CydC [Glutamicibacter mysorens]